jgi:hypothetical protein
MVGAFSQWAPPSRVAPCGPSNPEPGTHPAAPGRSAERPRSAGHAGSRRRPSASRRAARCADDRASGDSGVCRGPTGCRAVSMSPGGAGCPRWACPAGPAGSPCGGLSRTSARGSRPPQPGPAMAGGGVGRAGRSAASRPACRAGCGRAWPRSTGACGGWSGSTPLGRSAVRCGPGCGCIMAGRHGQRTSVAPACLLPAAAVTARAHVYGKAEHLEPRTQTVA